MMRVAEFDALCAKLKAHIDPVARVQFSIQTNAMLVNEEWIELFSKYNINVGVSLDGDKATNDKFRIDHVGRGTYDRVMVGVNKLFAAAEAGKIPRPAVLCVIDPSHDGAKTFRHFTNKIGFKWIDFLLPIDTNDSLQPAMAKEIGKYLVDVFNAWNELGDKEVSIRFFDQFYSFMTGRNRLTGAPGVSERNAIITIASDGTYGPDDTLRIVSDEMYSFDTRTDKLTTYLDDARIAEVNVANTTIPAECTTCSWARYCVGGSKNGRVVNRFSKTSGFAKKSGLCDGLNDIYSVLARHLVSIGYPPDKMFERLNVERVA